MARKLVAPVLTASMLAASIAAAEPPPSPEPPQGAESAESDAATPNARRALTAQERADFADLVQLGDEERRARKWMQAASLYEAALDIRPDPLVQGRLGLVLLAIGDPSLDGTAANALYAAVLRSAGVDKAERRQIWEAYDTVFHRVCRLTLVSNFVEADIALDDGHFAPSFGLTWTFVRRGKHKARGRLKGSTDIEKTFECIANEDVEVVFEFETTPPAEPPPPVAPPTPPAPPAPPAQTVVIREIREAAPLAREAAPKVPSAGPFAIGVGPAMVIGAAPSPSFGVAISGQYRREGFSAVALARGAWSIGDVKGRPIDIFSASAIVGPCIRWQWLDGCAFGGAILFEQRMEPNALYYLRANTNIIPALGLGVGATYPLKDGLSARVFVDAAALTHDLILGVVSHDGTTIPVWQTQRFLFSASVSLMFGR